MVDHKIALPRCQEYRNQNNSIHQPMTYVTQVFGCPRREQNWQYEKRAWGLPEIKYSTATVSTAFITHLMAGS